MAGKSESDYYKVLGVAEGASAAQIRRAYRRLAMRYHPDRNGSPEAAEKFKQVREAYAVLSGKEKPPKHPEPRREAEAVFRHAMQPVSYEAAEFSLRAQRVWEDLANESHNNSYR
jgi:DnaJ-class molecular chaperone